MPGDSDDDAEVTVDFAEEHTHADAVCGRKFPPFQRASLRTAPHSRLIAMLDLAERESDRDLRLVAEEREQRSVRVFSPGGKTLV